jgi:hypothetical protein
MITGKQADYPAGFIDENGNYGWVEISLGNEQLLVKERYCPRSRLGFNNDGKRSPPIEHSQKAMKMMRIHQQADPLRALHLPAPARYGIHNLHSRPPIHYATDTHILCGQNRTLSANNTVKHSYHKVPQVRSVHRGAVEGESGGGRDIEFGLSG